MNINGIATPALIVDEKIFNENKEKMKALLEGKTLKLRPHYKSHKCADIAREQIKDGAVGMTCAKLDEAKQILGKTGRIVVRPSGTEPLIRVMVEGSDIEQIEAIARDVADVITSRLASK